MKQLTNEKKDFIMDLQEFAKVFIDEVQQVICNHIDELYEDEAIRYLVKRYAEEERNREKWNKSTLLDAYQFEHDIVSHISVYDYHDALYDLCYKRYTLKA